MKGAALSESELQACLARIYVDEPFRLLSRIDPSVTIDRYDLSPDERSAVLTLNYRMVDFFAADLRNKRRRRFENLFPAVFKIDRSRALRLWDRFYDLAGAIAYESADAAFVAFGKFLEESVASAEWPAYARDLVGLENTILMALPWNDDSRGLCDSGDAPDLNGQYILAGNVRLRTFRYDVFKLREDLDGGIIPDDANESPVHIAIRLESDFAASTFFRLNEPAMLVLKSCNGIRSAREIVSKVQSYYGTDRLEGAILELIGKLQDQGIIRKSTANA